MKILFVLTSIRRIPGTDHLTGTWLEELAAPYFAFVDAGAQVTLVSVAGGVAPMDPLSERQAAQTPATRRFARDPAAQQAVSNTLKLNEIDAGEYDAVFFSGGLGPVFDLADHPRSIALIEQMDRSRKPIAAVCHGVAVFRHARGSDGRPMIQGRAVTGFSNSEELAVNGPDLVPWMIENEMRRLGGRYSAAADGSPHVVVDGNLITGQNPASSQGAAEKLLQALRSAPSAYSSSSPICD